MTCSRYCGLRVADNLLDLQERYLLIREKEKCRGLTATVERHRRPVSSLRSLSRYARVLPAFPGYSFHNASFRFAAACTIAG
jgi:hypothetical protein